MLPRMPEAILIQIQIQNVFVQKYEIVHCNAEELLEKQFERGPYSTEVAFALHTQQPGFDSWLRSYISDYEVAELIDCSTLLRAWTVE